MFIPLDSIQVKPTNDKYRNFARGARLAIDVIDFDPQFEAAMQHACGNSLICDTMDVARYVCYDKQQDVKGQSGSGVFRALPRNRNADPAHFARLLQPSRSRAPSSIRADPSPADRAPTAPAGSGTRRRSRVRPARPPLPACARRRRRQLTQTDAGPSPFADLGKQRDSLMNYLQELSKARPRGKSDDLLLSEISRCDSELALVRDDLVRGPLSRRFFPSLPLTPSPPLPPCTGARFLRARRSCASQACGPSSTTPARSSRRRRPCSATCVFPLLLPSPLSPRLTHLILFPHQRRTSLTAVEQEAATLAEAVNSSEDEVFADFCARIRVANIREYEDVQLRVAEAQTEARRRYTAQSNRLQRQLEFETEQLQHTQSRLRVLDKNLKADRATLGQLEADRDALEAEIAETEKEIGQAKTDVEELQTKLADVGSELEDTKRRSSKATKSLDRIMKEVAAWVRRPTRLPVVGAAPIPDLLPRNCRTTPSPSSPLSARPSTGTARLRTSTCRSRRARSPACRSRPWT